MVRGIRGSADVRILTTHRAMSKGTQQSWFGFGGLWPIVFHCNLWNHEKPTSFKLAFFLSSSFVFICARCETRDQEQSFADFDSNSNVHLIT